MRVVVNGSQRSVAEGTNVEELVRICAPAGVGDRVAVARNAEVVPRSSWRDTTLADGDQVELLAAVQGGS